MMRKGKAAVLLVWARWNGSTWALADGTYLGTSNVIKARPAPRLIDRLDISTCGHFHYQGNDRYCPQRRTA